MDIVTATKHKYVGLLNFEIKALINQIIFTISYYPIPNYANTF